MKEKLQQAIERVNAAIAEYKPIAVFGLFSGGNDSLPATFIASQASQFDGVVHINTGIGVEATRDFVRQTCADRKWKLLEYKAMENVNARGELDPQSYDELVFAYGFPGPQMHFKMYQRLKERQLNRLQRERGCDGRRGVRVLYVSGQRSAESARRKRNVEPMQVEPQRIWVAPIHDWTSQDCADLREHVGLKQNIVCERIGMSGECLCGAFAKPGELEILRGWPETREAYSRIKALEVRVREAGFPWGWGERPPEWFQERKAGQRFFFDMESDDLSPVEMPLCHNCIKHHGGRP